LELPDSLDLFHKNNIAAFFASVNAMIFQGFVEPVINAVFSFE
jgi:hypothetical protein